MGRVSSMEPYADSIAALCVPFESLNSYFVGLRREESLQHVADAIAGAIRRQFRLAL
jgi:hypothetical protein